MRIKGFDFLRGIAIILVLFRHSDLRGNLFFFGWLGVDLFFVLSGFLVSGLLFQEYIKNDKVNIKRFLVRRGFKIYPPFYFFVAVSIWTPFLFEDLNYSTENLRNELLYLQSYLPRIWLHTWSLAVEEHFYLGFAFFMFLAVKLKILKKKKRFILFLVLLLLLTFNMRLNISSFNREGSVAFMQTHLRGDGIVVGVLISYLYYFTDWVKPIFQNYLLYLIVALFLILPGFQFKGGYFFMNTFGLTYVNLGFGLLVLLSIKFEDYLNVVNLKILKILFAIICFIGVHSYSIYLWHYSLKLLVYKHLDFSGSRMNLIYMFSSIGIGIALSLIIEKPFLKIRDSKRVKRWLGTTT